MSDGEAEPDFAVRQAEERRAAFLAAVPKPLLDREDAIPDQVANANASTRVKLKRVYLLMDEMSAYRADHVACRRACSACCRMNVTITAAEAEAISAATGRRAANLIRTVEHPQDEFIGTPCPFLAGDECSIYENRPLSCRKHASYFVSERWCSPPYLNTLQAPLVRFGGLDEALALVSMKKGQIVFADIRDFSERRRSLAEALGSGGLTRPAGLQARQLYGGCLFSRRVASRAIAGSAPCHSATRQTTRSGWATR